jgi:hypothetical protein
VVPDEKVNDRRLRRYQLLAEKAQTSVFLLSEKPSSTWAISCQIKAEASDTCRVIKEKIRLQ